MRRLLKLICVIATLLCTVLLLASPCSADTASDSLWETVAPEGLRLPEQIAGEFADAGIDPEQPESLLSVTPEQFFAGICEKLRDEAAAPLRLLPAMLMLILAAALTTGLADSFCGSDLRMQPDMICTLICAGIVTAPVMQALERTADTLRTGEMFTAGFVPVFAGFMVAGGNPGTGAAYQIFVLFLAGTVMAIAGNVLLPLLRMACALGITDAAAPSLRLGGIVSGLRKAVTWTLGTVMALFSAMLTVRSFVASAADSLTAKTVKLLSSGLIPIVGSAVSDAYGTIRGSIALLRSGVGAAGILAILFLILPPLLYVGVCRVILILCRCCSEMTDVSSLTALFRNAEAVLSACFAILVCYALMQIFSAAIALILIQH